MNKRSVVMVIVLYVITLGIYQLVWLVKTKNEMNKYGANLPTAWWWLVPFAMIWWQWKWAGGVEHFTRGKQQQATVFMLSFVLSVLGLGFVGMAIIQAGLNQAIDQGFGGQLPQARVA